MQTRSAIALTHLVDRRQGLFFVLIFSAFLLGAVFWLNSDAAVNHDALAYITAAQAIASGNWSNALLAHPLAFYPTLIAAIHALGPDWVTAARLISYFSILLTLIPLYFLAKDLFDARTAFWAILTFTLSPEPLRSGFMVIREPLYTFLLILFVFMVQRAVFTKKSLYLLGAAIAIFLAVLCRPEGIIVFLMAVCFMVWRAIANPEHRRHSVKVALASLLFATILTSSAWLASSRGFAIIGKDNAYFNMYLKDIVQGNVLSNYGHIQERLSEMEQASHYEIAGDNFASFARRFIPLIYMLGVAGGVIKTIAPSNLVALLAGLWCFRAVAAHRFILFLAAAYAAMIYGFVIYLDFFDPRFMFFPAVLLYPWVGFGVSQTIIYFSRGRRGRVLATAAALFFCFTPLYKSNHLFMAGEDAILQAGKWLSSQPELKSGRLAATDDRILFYAFEQTTSYRNEIACRQIFTVDFTCLGEAIRREGIDALFIYDDIEKPSAPESFNGYHRSREFKTSKKAVFVYQPERPPAP